MASELMAPETRNEPTVMQILSSAVLAGNVNVDVVERLTKLQREQVEYQAEVDFNNAMHRCQENMKPIVAKTKGDKGMYANYRDIDKIMRPIYTGEGFSLSFSEADCPIPTYIRLVCYVSRGGHTRTYQKDWPVVTKGAKGNDVMTPTHAHGSADSYAKRYLLKDIFNIAVGDADDDGAGGHGSVLPENELVGLLDNIAGCETKEDVVSVFQAAYRFVSEKFGDRAAMDELISAKNKRKEQLAKAAK